MKPAKVGELHAVQHGEYHLNAGRLLRIEQLIRAHTGRTERWEVYVEECPTGVLLVRRMFEGNTKGALEARTCFSQAIVTGSLSSDSFARQIFGGVK